MVYQMVCSMKPFHVQVISRNTLTSVLYWDRISAQPVGVWMELNHVVPFLNGTVLSYEVGSQLNGKAIVLALRPSRKHNQPFRSGQTYSNKQPDRFAKWEIGIELSQPQYSSIIDSMTWANPRAQVERAEHASMQLSKGSNILELSPRGKSTFALLSRIWKYNYHNSPNTTQKLFCVNDLFVSLYENSIWKVLLETFKFSSTCVCAVSPYLLS